MPEDQYTHGHHESVVSAHSARTIANSAAYLEPHLHPGATLLDVGCGPGSITAEFAERLAPGTVLGVDLVDDVIAAATERFGGSGAEFAVMDCYALDVPDDQYDIVHAHQVLQHVSDPVAVLREMRRVAKPGGVVAVRDADYAAMHWAPEYPELDRWLEIYRNVCHDNDAEPDAGRWLLSWARAAGFDDITPTTSTWLFADGPSRQWWGSAWRDRILESGVAEQSLSMGHATRDELEQISRAWVRWADEPAGWFVIVHGELVCRA